MTKVITVLGLTYTLSQASKHFKISADLIRARINKLGWTEEEAVGVVIRNPQDRKAIVFRGVKYSSQEDFVKSVSKFSKFSEVTLKIKLAKLNKQKKECITEIDLENLVSGVNQFQVEGGWVYLIQCKSAGKNYVGISIRDPIERWKAHISEAYFSNSNSPLKSAIREYGEKSFTVKTIGYYETNKELKLAEKLEIEKRNTFYPNGLNANRGGTLGALDVKPINFEGKNYRSISEIARQHGIKRATLHQRINSYGMSLKEAITFDQDLSVTYMGVDYSSKRELCESLGLPYQRIIGLLNQGFSLEDSIQKIKKIVKCLICEKSFTPKTSLNKYCSQKCKFESQYQRNRLGLNPTPNKKSITYMGKSYESVSELSRVLGIPRSKLSKAINRYESVDKAIEVINKI